MATAKAVVEKKTYRLLKVYLDHEELRQKGQEIARKYKEIQRIKAAAKSAASNYKSQIESLEEQVSNLTDAVDSKSEYRHVEVRKLENYDTGIVSFMRIDTAEIIEERVMTEDERQQGLFPADEEKETGAEGDGAGEAAAVEGEASEAAGGDDGASEEIELEEEAAEATAEDDGASEEAAQTEEESSESPSKESKSGRRRR